MSFSDLSANQTGIGIVTHDQVCGIIEDSSKGDKTNVPLLIDVRKPSEIEQSGGTIPTAKNIPLADVSKSLQMPPEDFQAKFGFPKPSKEDPLVFYCVLGVRCKSAAEQAFNLGYKAFSYPGSWTEWQEKCKK